MCLLKNDTTIHIHGSLAKSPRSQMSALSWSQIDNIFFLRMTLATKAALTPLTPAQLDEAALKCLHLQQSGQDIHGKRPFAAILLAPDNESQLMSSLSLSHVRHAECELARNAADNYSWDYLAGCTMVSTWEPCAMCAGTIYWAHIGRLVYLASEGTLQQLTGEGNSENLTLNLPCREIFSAGQTQVEVIGPLAEEGWEAKVATDSNRYWSKHSRE